MSNKRQGTLIPDEKIREAIGAAGKMIDLHRAENGDLDLEAAKIVLDDNLTINVVVVIPTTGGEFTLTLKFPFIKDLITFSEQSSPSGTSVVGSMRTGCSVTPELSEAARINLTYQCNVDDYANGIITPERAFISSISPNITWLKVYATEV